MGVNNRLCQASDAGITELLLTKTDRVMGSKQWELPQSTTLGSMLTIGPIVLAIKITVSWQCPEIAN